MSIGRYPKRAILCRTNDVIFKFQKLHKQLETIIMHTVWHLIRRSRGFLFVSEEPDDEFLNFFLGIFHVLGSTKYQNLKLRLVFISGQFSKNIKVA